MTARNRFTLLRYEIPGDRDDPRGELAEEYAVPVIDDVPLFERLGDRWPGVPVHWVLPPSRHWLGEPVYEEFEGRTVVLDGSCGCAGCCGVGARIHAGPDTVVWDDFYGHGAPSVPDGLRFEFARADYEAEFTRLATRPAQHWAGDEA